MAPRAHPRPLRSSRPGREAGFALLIVLWSLVMITMLVTAMIASGRSQARITSSLRSAAVARAAVDGAVTEAMFRLSAGDWQPAWEPGPPRRLRIGATMIELQLEDEAGRVNINDVPPRMMAALLETVGVPSALASALASAIEDYHTPGDRALPGGAKAPEYAAAGLPYGPSGRAFRTVAELGQVLGMTPEIMARLAPHVSAAKVGGLDLAKADPVVLRAFAAAGPDGGGYPKAGLVPGDVATVRIVARSQTLAAATRVATVRIAAQDAPGPAYLLMSWE